MFVLKKTRWLPIGAIALLAALSAPAAAQTCTIPSAWQTFADREGALPTYGTPSNCSKSGNVTTCTYPNGGTKVETTSGTVTNQSTSVAFNTIPYYRQTVAGGLGVPAQYDLSSAVLFVSGSGTITSTSASDGSLISNAYLYNQTWTFPDGFSTAVELDYLITYGSQGSTTGTVYINNVSQSVSDLLACSYFTSNGLFSFPQPATPPIDPTQPIVGDPNQPLPPAQPIQPAYIVNDGVIPEAAVVVTPVGTLGNATIDINIDLSKILSQAFAAGYNLYVGALVPGQQLNIPGFQWFMKQPAGGWDVLAFPLVAFLENVAVGSANQVLAINVVANTNISTLIGTEIYIGYGTDSEEMLNSKRYRGIYRITTQ